MDAEQQKRIGEMSDDEWAREVVKTIDPQLKSIADKLWDRHPNNPKNKTSTETFRVAQEAQA